MAAMRSGSGGDSSGGSSRDLTSSPASARTARCHPGARTGGGGEDIQDTTERSENMVRAGSNRVGRLGAICLALPAVTGRPSHGAPTWFVRDKSAFATLWADGHHQDDFPHLWCAAAPGAQEELVQAEPLRFFRPPYVGGRGWLGVRL